MPSEPRLDLPCSHQKAAFDPLWLLVDRKSLIRVFSNSVAETGSVRCAILKMGTHRLPAGVRMIELLTELGNAMGYESLVEYKLPSEESTAQAVDLAWSRGARQTP